MNVYIFTDSLTGLFIIWYYKTIFCKLYQYWFNSFWSFHRSFQWHAKIELVALFLRIVDTITQSALSNWLDCQRMTIGFTALHFGSFGFSSRIPNWHRHYCTTCAIFTPIIALQCCTFFHRWAGQNGSRVVAHQNITGWCIPCCLEAILVQMDTPSMICPNTFDLTRIFSAGTDHRNNQHYNASNRLALCTTRLSTSLHMACRFCLSFSTVWTCSHWRCLIATSHTAIWLAALLLGWALFCITCSWTIVADQRSTHAYYK